MIYTFLGCPADFDEVDYSADIVEVTVKHLPLLVTFGHFWSLSLPANRLFLICIGCGAFFPLKNLMTSCGAPALLNSLFYSLKPLTSLHRCSKS